MTGNLVERTAAARGVIGPDNADEALSRLDAMPTITTVTQTQYDALPAPDANTLYVIVEG